MKTNEVIARTIQSAGVNYVSCVPGFGGTQVYEAYCGLLKQTPAFSFHEEVAFASALGTSIAGKKSVMLTKVHGLAKAANAVTDSLYMSFEGAMLVFVFEDTHGRHSDTILLAEPLLRGLRLPYFDANHGNISQTIYQAFEKSIHLKIPVAIVLNADIVNEEGYFVENTKTFKNSFFKRNLLHHLVVPVFADYQHKVMLAKLDGRNFEETDKPGIPEIPGGLPPDYANYVKPYMPLMEIFKAIRGPLVFGDTGISTLFAFPPFECVDACAYMGGSVAMACGACKAGYKNTWAVSGDFSFIAAGHLGLIEAVSKNIPVKILIFKNNKAQTTGGQSFGKDILGNILRGYGEFVSEITNPDDEILARTILTKAAESDKLHIVVANYDSSD